MKAARGAYLPGRRDWIKVESRNTTEVIVGGVIGPLERPRQLVAGVTQADPAEHPVQGDPAAHELPIPDECSSVIAGRGTSRSAMRSSERSVADSVPHPQAQEGPGSATELGDLGGDAGGHGAPDLDRPIHRARGRVAAAIVAGLLPDGAVGCWVSCRRRGREQSVPGLAGLGAQLVQVDVDEASVVLAGDPGDLEGLYVGRVAGGAHPCMTLTLFIALFQRDHGPVEYQLAYARALDHVIQPYPDITT